MKKIILVTLFLCLILPIQANAFDLSKANIGMIRTNLPIVNQTNVCVSDIDKSHSQVVSDFVYKYYNGQITQIQFNGYNFNTFQNCDVINSSIATIPFFFGYRGEELKRKYQEFRYEEYDQLYNFLHEYKGIIVESAGNEDEGTTYSSSIARFKEWSEDESINNRLFVVGQIEITDEGTYVHHFSYGDEIDFVVANYGEMVGNKRYTGTSYSSPVATAIISTLIQAGIPVEDIRDVIGYEEELHYWNGKSYRVLDVFKTIRNAYKYLEMNK